MQKSLRFAVALALIGLGVWGWFFFFPSPEKVIRSRLETLARTISFEPTDGLISRGYNAEKAAGFFTLDAEVSVDGRGFEPLHFSGREELRQGALIGSRALHGLKVKLFDINVTLEAGQQSAKANLTGQWTISGSRDFDVMEFNFLLRKVDGKWLIYRVESVKTLSQVAIHTA